MVTPLILDTIEINQPLAPFYLINIKAKDLLELAFTDPLRYEDSELKGNQRQLDEKVRLKEIKEYVESIDAAFPNTIIISANYDENGLNCENDELRWRVENKKLIIPTDTKLASIIDGQHRLFGFKNANDTAKETELACSVYLDLPNALQALLFATINSTQKSVDKSLAYEQFGFNIDNEDSTSWSPDKLAIALYRKLNDSKESPFYKHIKVAPQIDDVLRKELKEQKWLVSTASVVDGIIRLISTNPKKDKRILQKIKLSERKRSALEFDAAPLRLLYIENEDVVIYQIVINYFNAADTQLFKKAPPQSSIIKTIGIQGLFDALRKIIQHDLDQQVSLDQIDFSQTRFEGMLDKVANVDFSDNLYQFSAVGRANVLETILLANDIIKTPEVNQAKNENDQARIEKKIANHLEINKLLNR